MGDNESTMMLSQTWRMKRLTNYVASQKMIFLVLSSIYKSSKFEADKKTKEQHITKVGKNINGI